MADNSSTAAKQAEKMEAAKGRPDFLVPHKIRDRIYRQLLFYEHVHEAPYYVLRGLERSAVGGLTCEGIATTAQMYRFHADILAANRAINREASEVLNTNLFIVASHTWSEIHLGLHAHGVPVVTDSLPSGEHFKRHAMRVRLAGRKDTLLKSFIILAADLPRFCQLVQWVYYGMTSPAPVLTHINEKSMRDPHAMRGVCSPKEVFKTKIHIMPAMASVLSAPDHEALLLLFRNMIVGHQEVAFLNCDDVSADLKKDLKETMGPLVYFSNVKAWHMLEMSQDMQKDVDRLAHEGQYEAACKRYMILLSNYDQVGLLNMPKEAYESSTAVVVGMIARIMMDAAANFGLLRFKLGRVGDIGMDGCVLVCGAKLQHFICDLPEATRRRISDIPKNNLHHIGTFWLIAVTNFLHSRKPATIEGTQEMFALMRKAMPNDERLRHDQRLVRDTLGDPKRRKAFYSDRIEATDLVKEISAAKLPLKLFRTSLPAGLKKPAGMNGFTNIEHHRVLAENFREKMLDKVCMNVLDKLAKDFAEGKLEIPEEEGE